MEIGNPNNRGEIPKIPMIVGGFLASAFLAGLVAANAGNPGAESPPDQAAATAPYIANIQKLLTPVR